MDGRKAKLIHSLQFRLSIGSALAILLAALLAGGFSYWGAFQEAIKLQDQQLIDLSALVNNKRITQQDADTPISISSTEPEAHFVVQWLNSDREQMTVELPGLSDQIPEGLQTRIVNNISWRILAKTMNDGARVIVAQQTEMRDEIASINAFNTIVPLIILMPLLIMMVAYLIRQVFSPLKRMAAQLDSSADYDLRPLPEDDLALEVSPFVMAINRLLGRVNQSITVQRKFVRDAAHELRSPLTSISLQTEQLIDLAVEPVRSKLINLHKATERTQMLVDQLLTMARVQEEQEWSGVTISLKAILRDVLEDLLPLAEVKEIEVTVLGEDIIVQSHAIDLYILIKNLIDNAIRYTPNHGKVDILLSVNKGVTELTIRDSGPGICLSEQGSVFDPFYRILGNDQPGSGLGLCIVRNIAIRLGLVVDIIDNEKPDQPGLSVRVAFPEND